MLQKEYRVLPFTLSFAHILLFILYVCECEGLSSTLSTFLNKSPPWFMRQHLGRLWTADSSKLASQLESSRNLLVSSSLVLGLQTYTTMPSFWMWSWGLNSHPHACMTCTLWAEPLPRPDFLHSCLPFFPSPLSPVFQSVSTSHPPACLKSAAPSGTEG